MLNKFFKKRAFVPVESIPDVSGLLAGCYNDQVAKNHIQFDHAQWVVLKRLQTLLDKMPLIIASGLNSRNSSRIVSCRSLYIFGDVGRGKSMLMALFYEACPITQKRRVHFNIFMLEVHRFLHDWQRHPKTNEDALSALAKEIRHTAFLLCFDEFHVTDIADAMILGRLFSKLFALGVVVVITSNRHPAELYQGGLQREQFLFFIKILQAEADVIELVAKADYRLSHLPPTEITYYFPLDDHADDFIHAHYQRLTHFSTLTSGIIHVFGRSIYLTGVHENIALSSFEDLCKQALGSADYLAIAAKFSTLIVTDIPQLTAEKRNEAKRFVTLVDVLYEHKIRLICSAEVAAHALYIEGDGAFEFKRTVSRLMEMQSDAYLHKCRAAVE
jgi:cell division protein ZapE